MVRITSVSIESRVWMIVVVMIGVLSGALAGCSPASHPTPDIEPLPILPFVSSEGAQASRDYTIRFPDDHASHPEFAIEWWYFTSNLKNDRGEEYALQWTLFRFGQGEGQGERQGEGLVKGQGINDTPMSKGDRQSPVQDNHVYMGHVSLHTPDEHFFNERFASSRLKTAGVTTTPLHYFIDTMSWLSEGELRFPSMLSAEIVTDEGLVSIALALTAPREFILHGEQGYSIKTADRTHASHYYSQPFIDVAGTLKVNGEDINVTGQGWYDHEWSSQLINTDTLGWDWVSLHLDNGDKLMAFTMRTQGSQYVTGTIISAAGEQTTLSPDEITMRVLDKAVAENGNDTYPVHWAIEVPTNGLSLKVKATTPDAVNRGVFEYYEGAVQVSGSHTGVGFLEMTGYTFDIY